MIKFSQNVSKIVIGVCLLGFNVVYGTSTDTSQDVDELRKKTPLDADAFQEFCSAIERDDINEIERLYGTGKSVNATNHYDNGTVPLSFAIEKRNYRAAEWLLQHGAYATTDGGTYGLDPKSIAAQRGDLEALKLFLKYGVGVNATNKCGESLISFVAASGNLEAVKFLQEKGANLSTSNNDRMTSVHSAAYGGNLEMMKLFLENDGGLIHATTITRGETPVFFAIRGNGGLDMVKLLAEKGADVVGVRDSHGETPFFHAVYCGTPEMIEWFLNNGADVDEKDNCEETPIFSAAIHGSLEKVKLLHRRGASLVTVNKGGETPFSFAIRGRDRETIQWFLDEKADVHRVNAHGQTLILVASIIGNPEGVELLLKHGAVIDVNTPDDLGWTPLHTAILHRRTDITKLLLLAGANPTAKNGCNKTPLDLAKECQNWEIVDLLRRHGAVK